MRGLGCFLTSRDCTTDDPGRMARRIKDAGLKWAAIFVEAPDGRRTSLLRAHTIGSALHAAELEVLVWTFPRSDHARDAARYACEAAVAAEARGVILDVERAPPGVVAPEWNAGSGAALIAETLDGLNEKRSYALTSYPMRSAFRTSIPWASLGAPVGMPQLYRTADEPRLAEKALAEWQEGHEELVPVVDSYRGNADRLRAVIGRMLGGNLDSPRYRGLGVWCWATCDGAERRVLRESAERLGW